MLPKTIIGCLEGYAACQPDKVAFTDGIRTLTYGALWDQANRRARGLILDGLRDCAVLLAFPTGLEFVLAFFACLLARAVAVPVPLPFGRAGAARVRSVAIDGGINRGWTSRHNCDALQLWSRRERLPLMWHAGKSDANAIAVEPSSPDHDHPAFVQCTSGSIAAPRLLVISHGNIMDNMERLVSAFKTRESDVGVCWLPHYHDMGLVGTILHTVHRGATSVLMTPSQFLRDPMHWLRTLHRCRATVTSASSFALRFCAERVAADHLAALDLRRLRVVVVGAEPVLPSAVDAFEQVFVRAGTAMRALHPSYGLAEATLIVSGRAAGARPAILDAPGGRRLVGCGLPLVDTAIVASDGDFKLADGLVGEICIRGASVVQQHWEPSGPVVSDTSEWIDLDGSAWRRTGDYGFLSEGELFVVGRRAGLLTVAGRSLHAEDLEATALQSHPSLRGGAAIALVVDDVDKECVVLIAETTHRHNMEDVEEVRERIARAVAATHGLRLSRVVVVQPRTLPRTTSGKVRRVGCNGLLSTLP